MQYTLDSVRHVIACLQKNYKKDFEETPLIINDLSKVDTLEDSFYFGVLTIGSNIVSAKCFNENGVEIITITKNSQIIDFCSDIKFYDADNNEVANPYGHFRGFEINPK